MKKQITAILTTALLLCAVTGCRDNNVVSDNSNDFPQSDISQNSTDLYTESTDNSSGDNLSDVSDVNSYECDFSINRNIISDLGLTFTQLKAKYGEPSGTLNSYEFENADFRYGWKSTEYFENMETAGGCNMINGMGPNDLFAGLTYPQNLEEFAHNYGFDIISIDKEPTLDGCFFSELSYPEYENVSFVFITDESGTMDSESGLYLVLNVDSLDAQPILTEH